MHRFVLSALALLPAAPLHAASIELQPGTHLELATKEEAAKLLAAPDEYLRRMSPFDREARMRIAEPPGLDIFAAHVAANALDWTEEETGAMRTATASLRVHLEPLHLAFPATITVVKTTGREDINLPYCRGPLIVFPESWLRQGGLLIGRVLAHEFFHVFSTHHPELRPEFYKLLQFEPCEELSLPPDIDKRRFTNPDAPRYDYFTRLPVAGREIAVIPAMIARTEHFNPARPINVFAQVEFRLIEIELKDRRAVPVLASDRTVRSHLAEAVPEYQARMAQNTHYIWHPEEVLADNFAHLLVPGAPLANRELPTRLLKLMQKR